MKKPFYKVFMLLSVCLVVSSSLSGCKPSEKKVVSSSYYKELNKKYKKLKKENEELKEELASRDEPSEDEQRASDYLEKIGRDRIINLEVGYADNMEGSELIKDKEFFGIATAIAKRADLTERYTPEEIEKKYGPGYEYVLYDEDNAVYVIRVYKGDYVVFTDLPDNVYYSYRAGALGDAFMHYRNGYPNSRLLHRLADSPLVSDGSKCYENDSAFEAANYIRSMDRKQTSRKKAEEAWKKAYLSGKKKSSSSEDSGEPELSEYEPDSKSYTFYHHGNVMTMTLYKEHICILNMDDKETWYKAEPEEIKELKKKFAVSWDIAAKNDSSDQSKSTKKQSHEKEIEEESDISLNDN